MRLSMFGVRRLRLHRPLNEPQQARYLSRRLPPDVLKVVPNWFTSSQHYAPTFDSLLLTQGTTVARRQGRRRRGAASAGTAPQEAAVAAGACWLGGRRAEPPPLSLLRCSCWGCTELASGGKGAGWSLHLGALAAVVSLAPALMRSAACIPAPNDPRCSAWRTPRCCAATTCATHSRLRCCSRQPACRVSVGGIRGWWGSGGASRAPCREPRHWKW